MPAMFQGIPLPPKGERPTIDDLREWVFDGVAEAIDGCTVEPDGYCEHDMPSWLLVFGMI